MNADVGRLASAHSLMKKFAGGVPGAAGLSRRELPTASELDHLACRSLMPFSTLSAAP